MAGGPIRRMISNVTACRSSCSGSSNRFNRGSERCAPRTRAASAAARTFGSLARRRWAQDSVRGSGVWANATPWPRPAANTIARACLVNTDALDDDARAIGDAKAERRRVLHVAGLADDDVHVGIRVARAGVVDSQRGGRSIPDRDRAARAALGPDEGQQ